MNHWPQTIQQTPPLASGDARDDRAPAVVQGTPFGNSTNLAIAEEQNRKRMFVADPTTVTTIEMGQSRRRRVALETTEALITHGMGFGAVLAAVQANGVAIQANGVAIQAMQATMQNLRRREKNRNGTWTRILVERPGANPIGLVPPNCPQSKLDVLSMSAAQIVAFETALNLPPGYFDGATLATRRTAVLEYLCEG